MGERIGRAKKPPLQSTPHYQNFVTYSQYTQRTPIWLAAQTAADKIQLQLSLGFPNPIHARSDSNFILLGLLPLLLLPLVHFRSPAPFAQFLSYGHRPFLSFEEVILEYQPALLDRFSLQGCILWDSSKQISEKAQVCSPEIQGCGPAF
ncbi:hypothetical protein QYF61_008803 [Mycteria americana]|uniref:Uncharacterized protein n=1 Tax=Mycteria americana TaxID=33587 RepID=A0AAN7NGC8_MYCAM|nr:hypothetical protein QYF61_008803 [Mycteria americana]